MTIQPLAFTFIANGMTLDDQNSIYHSFSGVATDASGNITAWNITVANNSPNAVNQIDTCYIPGGNCIPQSGIVKYGLDDITFGSQFPSDTEFWNYESPGAWATNGCQVALPRVGQCDLPVPPKHWGQEPYAFSNWTMCKKGCATTSLSRALVFQGIDTIPLSQGNSSNDPGYLNDFMKPRGQDYSPDSGVNWDETTRDVTSSPGQNNLHWNSDFSNEIDPGLHTFSQAADDLEKIVCGQPLAPPKSEFPQQATPVVVGVVSQTNPSPLPPPGHFVLVTGMQVLPPGPTCTAYIDSTGQCVDFTIDDPCGTPHTNLSQYNNFVIRGFVQDPPADNSGLDLVVGAGVNVLLVDPSGNRTGVDSTGAPFKEIPGSGYFAGEIDDDESVGDTSAPITRTVDVFQPPVGTYTVSLSGLQQGTYTLSLSGYSQDGTKQNPVTQSEPISPGSTQSYQVVYDPTPGSTLQVKPMFPIFALSAGPLSPSSIKAGASSTSPISVASMNGFSSPVTLTCLVSPTPPLAPTCSLNPASVTPPGNGTGTSTLTVATTGASAANTQVSSRSSCPLFAVWLFLPSMLVISIRVAGPKRRRLTNYFLLLLAMSGCLSLVACGSSGGNSGGGGSPGTAVGTYTITVTSSASGLIPQTSSVSLTVQ